MTKWLFLPLYFFIIFFLATAQFFIRNASMGETYVIPTPSSYVGLSIDPQIIRRFLGMRLLVADIVWIDTLAKADIIREQKPFTTFYQASKVMTSLDPDGFLAYYVAGLYLSVIKDDIPGATAILREGATYLEKTGIQNNHSWRLMFALGYHLLFEENELEEGSQWVVKASKQPSSPQYVKDLGKHLMTESGRLEIGERILADLYQRATRPEEKKRIEEKILNITVKLDATRNIRPIRN